jgi:hypothetical protein
MASVALRMASSRPAAAARRRGTAFFSELIRGLPIFSHSIRIVHKIYGSFGPK